MVKICHNPVIYYIRNSKKALLKLASLQSSICFDYYSYKCLRNKERPEPVKYLFSLFLFYSLSEFTIKSVYTCDKIILISTLSSCQQQKPLIKLKHSYKV